jgi:aryl-phospho-beta-D-glucosidase BglC (GH1 family)
MKRREMSRFVVKDASGNPYTIIVYKKLKDVTPINATVREYAPIGVNILETEDGTSVLWLKKGHYQIENKPPIPISSDDPNAL